MYSCQVFFPFSITCIVHSLSFSASRLFTHSVILYQVDYYLFILSGLDGWEDFHRFPLVTQVIRFVHTVRSSHMVSCVVRSVIIVYSFHTDRFDVVQFESMHSKIVPIRNLGWDIVSGRPGFCSYDNGRNQNCMLSIGLVDFIFLSMFVPVHWLPFLSARKNIWKLPLSQKWFLFILTGFSPINLGNQADQPFVSHLIRIE